METVTSPPPTDTYRLWQLWQQMHYPTPVAWSAETGVDLVALDGKAGASLERYFEGPQDRVLDEDCRACLEECLGSLELVTKTTAGDTPRYFQRLHALIRLILDEAREPALRR